MKKINENKEKKSFKYIILILILILLFIIIGSTYSKYITQTDNLTNLDISNWNIKVNNLDITENKNFSDTITLTLDQNENVTPGVIVPTTTGSFEVNLESTGTELPFQYEFKISDTQTDTTSSYTTILKEEPWSSDNITFTYPIILNLDYSYLDKPIWYYYTNTESPYNSGQFYDELEIQIVLPDGFSCEPTYLENCLNYSIDGNVVKFTPQWYSWNKSSSTDVIFPDPNNPTYSSNNYSNNTLTQELHLTYNGKIDVNLDDFWNSVSIDGKQILKNNLPDYKIVAYSLNGGEKIPVTEDNGTITGIVEPPTDADGNFTGAQVINNFKLYVEWYDGADNVFDNSQDVAASKPTSQTQGIASIPVELKVSQIDPNTQNP